MSNPEQPAQRRRAANATPRVDAEADSLGALRSGARALGIELGQVELRRFAAYLRLIVEWKDHAGLTSLREPAAIERRHFVESLALLAVLRARGLLGEEPVRVVDVGPGAGFPSLPMCIVDPAMRLTLLEAHGRRAAFLELAARELALESVTVLQSRAEEAGRDPALRAGFDLAVARAVAPLPVLVEYALPLLRAGGVLAAPKGSGARRELEEAGAAIAALGGEALPPEPLPAVDDAPEQLVLFVRRSGELDDRYPRRPGIPSKRPIR